MVLLRSRRRQPKESSRSQWALFCFAGKPKLPDGFEAETWAKLQDAVHAVHDKRPVSCSLEELYRVRPLARVHGRACKGELARHTVQSSSALLHVKQKRLGHRVALLRDACLQKCCDRDLNACGMDSARKKIIQLLRSALREHQPDCACMA